MAEDRAGQLLDGHLRGAGDAQRPYLLLCGEKKCGNYRFTVYVEDRAEPGSGADRF